MSPAPAQDLWRDHAKKLEVPDRLAGSVISIEAMAKAEAERGEHEGDSDAKSVLEPAVIAQRRKSAMNEPMLGRTVDPEEYGQLDTFPVDAPVSCRFDTSELEALCPGVPGVQPDIYHASIEYVARSAAIESKSLKLWLITFRDRRIFGEHLAAEIGQKIDAIEGVELRQVVLIQNVRAGSRKQLRTRRSRSDGPSLRAAQSSQGGAGGAIAIVDVHRHQAWRAAAEGGMQSRRAVGGHAVAH